MRLAARIVIVSSLVALFAAFFAALLAQELPGTRAILAQHVCGDGSELLQRITVTNQVSRRVTIHCRDAHGTVSGNVALAVLAQGLRLTWPPIAAAIGLAWWAIVLVRRGRAERRTAPGGDGQGDQAAAIVDRMVASSNPSLGDVTALLDALARQGAASNVTITRDERTLDLGAVLREEGDGGGARRGGLAGDSPDADVEASLRQLQRLFERGLLTREDYETRRAAILERAFG